MDVRQNRTEWSAVFDGAGEGCAACADDVRAGALEVNARPALLFSLPLACLFFHFSASLPASLVLVPPCSAFKR
jgi:hypothetical protein